MQEKALNLLIELDKLYLEVVNGNKNYQDRLDALIIDVLSFKEEDLSDEIIAMVIVAFNQKVNLITKISPLIPTVPITLAAARDEFQQIEFQQFQINNNYILGTLTIIDIESFKEKLFAFRDKLYAIPISDSNIIEIAKMKSKIQHYETEILEDEDILKVAYQNSN